MSSILTRDLSGSADERRADSIAALERRIAALERRTIAGIQRVSDFDATTVSTTELDWTDLGGPSVTVEVPSRDSLVLLDWTFQARATWGWAQSVIVQNGEEIFNTIQGVSANIYTEVRHFALAGGDPFSSTVHPAYDSTNALYPLRLEAGTYTFEFWHRLKSDTYPAYWRNRELWVAVV